MLQRTLRKMMFNGGLPKRAFSTDMRVTALHEYHRERLGGKMVPFAGYDMPV